MPLTGSKRGREDAILSAMTKIVTLCTMEPEFPPSPPLEILCRPSLGTRMEEEKRAQENADAERLHKQNKNILASEIFGILSDIRKQSEEEEDAPSVAAYKNAVGTDFDKPPEYRNTIATDLDV
jgi:hypothetical protein